MASPAYQESAFQNLTTHGIKGFQVTDSDAGGGGAVDDWTQRCHHWYQVLVGLAVGLAALLRPGA